MNLVLLYPHYLFDGTLYASTTAKTGFPATNVITGNRQSYYKSNAEVTGVNFDIDVSMLPASERACQYVYAGGFSLPVSRIGSASLICQGATNSAISTGVTEFKLDDADKSDLVGVKKEDLIIENPSPQARDYWRVSITKGSVSGNHTFDIRKIMLGRWWYPDIEPEAPFEIRHEQTYSRRVVRVIRLVWRYVDDSNLQIFISRIANFMNVHHLVLYSRNYDSILAGEKVFTCMLDSYNVDKRFKNKNVLDCTFKEIV